MLSEDIFEIELYSNFHNIIVYGINYFVESKPTML
jgi:hypothetical protein